MTIYVDSLFVLNAVLNYLLLYGSVRLAGAPICRRRMAASAILGGVYAVGCVIPGMEFLCSLMMKFVVFVLMQGCAFGWQKQTVKLGLLFLALSFAFCGVVMALMGLFGSSLMLINGAAYYPVDGKVLVLTAAVVYILTRTVLARLAEHTGGELVSVEITAGERTAKLTALHDTGNTLKDPVTNQRVLVVDWEIAKALLPAAVAAAISKEQFAHPTDLLPRITQAAAAGRWRLIPYRTVGNAGSLLLAMKCDCIRIGNKTIRNGLVAFSPTAVSDGGGYSALIGG